MDTGQPDGPDEWEIPTTPEMVERRWIMAQPAKGYVPIPGWPTCPNCGTDWTKPQTAQLAFKPCSCDTVVYRGHNSYRCNTCKHTTYDPPCVATEPTTGQWEFVSRKRSAPRPSSHPGHPSTAEEQQRQPPERP